MNKEVKILESGKIVTTTYQRQMVKESIKIKSVVSDIYRNLPDFAEPIIWINKVAPNEGRTITDVLDEFTNEFGENAFIMCEAGTLNDDLNPGGTVEEAREVIESQKGYILNAYFYNVFFNRRMQRSYNNPSICIYSNDKTEDFIKENMSSTNDKIIRRIVASSKIN